VFIDQTDQSRPCYCRTGTHTINLPTIISDQHTLKMTLHNYPEYEDNVVVSSGTHMTECTEPESSNHCLNEGKCFLVGSDLIKGCMCALGYSGDRCQVQNPAASTPWGGGSDKIVVHMLAIILFVLIVNTFIIFLYIYCTLKIRRRNQQNQQKHINSTYIDDNNVAHATGYEWSASWVDVLRWT